VYRTYLKTVLKADSGDCGFLQKRHALYYLHPALKPSEISLGFHGDDESTLPSPSQADIRWKGYNTGFIPDDNELLHF